MELREETKDDVVVFRFNGRLDATTSSEVFEKCTQTINRGRRLLVFDFSQLTFLSSAGLRTLLLLLKNLRSGGGKVVIFGQSQTIHQILDISGFAAMFQSVDSESAALAEARK
jgi:anti-sigma B factor antagonist